MTIKCRIEREGYENVNVGTCLVQKKRRMEGEGKKREKEKEKEKGQRLDSVRRAYSVLKVVSYIIC